MTMTGTMMTMTQRNTTLKDYIREIESFYKYNPDDELFDEGDHRIHVLRKHISSLPTDERRIFLIYLDQGSETKTGKILGCSRSPVHKVITKIKNQLKDILLKDNLK